MDRPLPIFSARRAASHRRFRRGLLAALAIAAATAMGAATATPVLGVVKLQDETGALPFQGGIGRVLTNILTNELAARPAFTVVERRRLAAILEEQDLGSSGRLRPGDGPRIGQLTGADYLVMGTVTAFQPGVEQHAVRGGFAGIGGSRRSETAYLAIDLRVVDTESGEIAYARTIEGRTTKATSSVEVALGGAGFGYEAFKSEADARVARAAVIEIIDYLECAMVRRDACLSEYADKDRRRVEATRRAIDLDGAPKRKDR